MHPSNKVTQENAATVVRYQKPVGDQAPRHERLSAATEAFIRAILSEAPECADRSSAIRHARLAKMEASAAIALEDPAEVRGDDGVARCSLCGEPMQPGEEMFKFHGSLGPCPVRGSDATLSVDGKPIAPIGTISLHPSGARVHARIAPGAAPLVAWLLEKDGSTGSCLVYGRTPGGDPFLGAVLCPPTSEHAVRFGTREAALAYMSQHRLAAFTPREHQWG